MSVGYDDALFVLGGDPSQIAGSAATWSAFASAASEAADGLNGLDTDEFVGDEADDYRQALDKHLSHRLRTSSDAWRIVGTALGRFSATLDDCQRQLRPLRGPAADAWQSLCLARHDAQASQRAWMAAYPDPTDGAAPLPYPQPSVDAADVRADAASEDLNRLLDAARSIRSVHDRSRNACVAEIRRAAGMRFAEPPGWFASLVGGVSGWIADHVPVLKTISAALKHISSIAGMLAMIPALAPFMAPIAVVTGAAAVGVDAAVMAATGQGSMMDLVLDSASILPGARAAVAVGAAQTAVTADRAAHGDGSWTDVLVSAASVVVGAKGGAHGASDGPRPHSRSEASPSAPMKDANAPIEEHAVDADGARPPGSGPAATVPPEPGIDSPGAVGAAPEAGSEDRSHYGSQAPPAEPGGTLPNTAGSPISPASTTKGTPDDLEYQDTTPEPADPPINLPPGTEQLYRAGAAKVPPEWGPPVPTRKSKRGKPGLRWFGPNPGADGVRIDVGETSAQWPTQRVDHVIVRSGGKVLYPDGTPIPATQRIQENWECHIPLTDWLKWREWNIP